MSTKQMVNACGRSLRTATAFVWALAATLSLSAAECVWNGASGSWGSDAGWKDGVKPSAAGDTVKITGEDVAVTVGDADIANFQLVAKVTVEKASSRLVVDTSAAVSSPAVFEGKGQFVKDGTSTMNLTTAGTYPDSLIGYLGGIVVQNGTLQLPHRDGYIRLSRVEVNGNGVLSLGSSPQTHVNYGLWGDGTITNPNKGCQLYLFCTDAENPPVFAGSFGGNVELTSYFSGDKGAIQYLTGTTDFDMTLRINGILGAKTLGEKGGASSLGTGSIPFRNRYSGLHFLNETDETTTKNFQFWSTGAALVRLRASTYGGMTFTGAWNLPAYTSFGPNYKYNTIVLEGENTERANVLTFTEAYDSVGRSTVYWRKEGTGIWRFANFKPSILGTFEVRRGTLEFDSMAEKGEACALGYATRTGPDVSDWPDADRVTEKVPLVAYAYRLGNAAEAPLTTASDYLPTMQYMGAADAVCTTRPFVIDGVGRILTTGGKLTLAGASAYTNGTHTLVLDGAAATTNQFASVTNGPLGTLNVVKRGAGKWTLPSNIDVGAVKAEQGTLTVGESYKFYRWTITANNQGAGGGWIASFNGFALMDKAGNMVNGTVGAQDEMRTGKLNHPEQLLPGEMCYGRANYGSTGNRYPAKSFHWDPGTQTFAGSAAAIDVTVEKNTESTHPIVYWRIDDGVEVAKYDILADGSNNQRAVAQWELAGSADGKTWDVLHTVDDSNMPAMPMANNTWYSTKQGGATPTKGFDIATGSTNVTVASVSAATGATLEFVGGAAGMSVTNLVLDANGGGTIKGVAFAESGTLVLENWSSAKFDTKLPLDLSGCTGYANVSAWKVVMNGKERVRNIVVEADGITVKRRGLTFVIE